MAHDSINDIQAALNEALAERQDASSALKGARGNWLRPTRDDGPELERFLDADRDVRSLRSDLTRAITEAAMAAAKTVEVEA